MHTHPNGHTGTESPALGSTRAAAAVHPAPPASPPGAAAVPSEAPAPRAAPLTAGLLRHRRPARSEQTWGGGDGDGEAAGEARGGPGELPVLSTSPRGDSGSAEAPPTAAPQAASVRERRGRGVERGCVAEGGREGGRRSGGRLHHVPPFSPAHPRLGSAPPAQPPF